MASTLAASPIPSAEAPAACPPMAEQPIMQHHQAFGRDLSNFDAASPLSSSKPGAALKKKSKSGAGAIPIFHDPPPLEEAQEEGSRREHDQVVAQQLATREEEVAELRALTAQLQHALHQAQVGRQAGRPTDRWTASGASTPHCCRLRPATCFPPAH